MSAQVLGETKAQEELDLPDTFLGEHPWKIRGKGGNRKGGPSDHRQSDICEGRAGRKEDRGGGASAGCNPGKVLARLNLGLRLPITAGIGQECPNLHPSSAQPSTVAAWRAWP